MTKPFNSRNWNVRPTSMAGQLALHTGRPLVFSREPKASVSRADGSVRVLDVRS